MAQELRQYQKYSLNALRSNLGKGIRTQILQLATGGGKTTVASALMQGAMAKGNRVYFIVDSLELVDQAAERFMADGLQVGIIQGDHWMTDYSKPVQVATIQTLKNRWHQIIPELRPKVVVIDEAHVIHNTHQEIINECKFVSCPIIGLSATPFRRGLGLIFDELVVGATTSTLTELGFLVPAICYAPFVPDLKGIKTGAQGDWVGDALSELMGDAQIVGDIVANWKKLANGRQTIVFAANVAHSKMVCEYFNRAGVVADHIDGYESDKDARTEKINAFRRGETTVLCNVAVLTKGFDAPETSCIVLARPTKSLMLHIQMIGRGLRTATGKANCIVLDHAGNCLRNGLPTDDLPEVLDMGKGDNPDRKERDKKEPVNKACGQCGHVSTKFICPACGFKPSILKDVEVKDGELYEIEQEEKPKFNEQAVADLYSEMLGYALSKGKKPGWAYYKCVQYSGRSPKARNLPPTAPTEKTLGIIKHMNIRAAKRLST